MSTTFAWNHVLCPFYSKMMCPHSGTCRIQRRKVTGMSRAIPGANESAQGLGDRELSWRKLTAKLTKDNLPKLEVVSLVMTYLLFICHAPNCDSRTGLIS
jgi:hypothetical protein